MTFIISPLHKKEPCEDDDTRFYHHKHTFGQEEGDEYSKTEGRNGYTGVFTRISHISLLPL